MVQTPASHHPESQRALSQSGAPQSEEKIASLVTLSSDLGSACRRCDADPGKVAPLVRDGVLVECLKCRIHISGEELFAIAAATEEAPSSDKVKRMRLGYCAREGCESIEFQLTFRNVPGLDWTAFRPHLEAARAVRSEAEGAERVARDVLKRRGFRYWARQIAVGIGIILLVFILRQWWVGGRIPIVNEPEKFRVDSIPPEADGVRH